MVGEPFTVLVELAERSALAATGLPAQKEIKPHWTGIGFEVAGHRVVAPMGEVSEILEVPPSTHLPGVESWVLGVANVRGKLLPLIDTDALITGSSSPKNRNQRVLVVQYGEMVSGLIVGDLYGMQHFPMDCYQEIIDESADNITDYLVGVFTRDDEAWNVFSPFKLSQDEKFANAAYGSFLLN